MIPALKQNNYTHPLTLKGSIKLFWFWFWFWIDEIISRCFQPFQPCPHPPLWRVIRVTAATKAGGKLFKYKIRHYWDFQGSSEAIKKKDSGFLFLYFNFLVWCSATWLALWLAFFTVLYKPLKHVFYSINVLATLLVGITSNPLTP